ncbi:hypothetical protein J0H58_36795 [bacterium]|nr:hypothetical protein [bacterium]
MAVSDCTFSGNAGGRGGAIYVDITTVLTLTRSTFDGNTADGTGGAIESQGALSVTASTFSGNTASAGGGIYAAGTTTITGSTFSGNTATGSTFRGGAVAVVGNDASLTLTGSILAGSPAGGELTLNLDGTASGSHNIVEDGTGVGTFFTDSLAADPLLTPLGDHGGPTRTMALRPGSPALDAGTGTDPDQRGVGVQGGRRDVGAFESRGFTLTVTGGSGQSTRVDTAFPSALVVTVTANDPGVPVAGEVVTFTAPGAGASAALSVTTAPSSPTGPPESPRPPTGHRAVMR